MADLICDPCLSTNQAENQQELLSSFKERKFYEFNNLIKCRDIDVDYFYGDPDNGTLLDLVCRSSGNGRYASILILNGASIWLKNHVTGKFALNEAIANSDPNTIQQLSMALRQRITTASDEFRNNLMHTAIEINDVDIMRFIARCLPQKPEHNPKAPHFVLLQGSIEAVRVFIEYFDVDKEFQRDPQCRAHTCREIILQKYPQLEPELPTRSISEIQDILFFYLRNGAPELFLSLADRVSEEILSNSISDNDKTYLHVACAFNHIDVVDALLERNIRVNKFAKNPGYPYNKTMPIMVAAYKGHYEIVNKLLSSREVELQSEGTGSVLHSLIRGMREEKNAAENHRRILKLFLERKFPFSERLNIDHIDELGMTALQLAIGVNHEFVIESLLNAGADPYIKDPDGKPTLTLIPDYVLESYFDSCISLKREWVCPTKIGEKMSFNYSVFRRLDQNSTPTGYEMESFDLMEQIPELRELFKHPLSKSFLYLKWCLVKKYYYLNLAFYLTFCVAMSVHIFQIQDCPTMQHDTETLSLLCHVPCLLPITLVFYSIFIIRELCQLSVSIRKYFGSLENWLEVVMISVIAAHVWCQDDAHLAATVILTSWIEFVLLLGKYPSFSIYIEMFKTVALNFAKFLTLYSILIGSFAYSFFILFRSETSKKIPSPPKNCTKIEGQQDDEDGGENLINTWKDTKISLIKSIIMMTGEFDASDLPLGATFSFSYVFFILFVFLVAMVLYSLLNGLAVSDTREIMEDAEVVALISRVKQISQLEHLAITNPFEYFRSLGSRLFSCKAIRRFENVCLSFRNKLYRDNVTLSSIIGKEMLISVRRSENNKIQTISKVKNFGNMPSDIVQQSEQILEKRNQYDFDNFDQNLPENGMMKDSSKKESVDEIVHRFSDQIRDLNLEINQKIAAIEVKMAKREENLVQSVQGMKKMLESVVQALPAGTSQAEREVLDEINK
ncbi:transient receptor potential cation channel protein painless-like [Planococcus citri]|uniref:transient receptor potential cation channel protein painless-like n=1 Tax=Planococcus citri TaxID=170843 RepID=UPI0031F7BD14